MFVPAGTTGARYRLAMVAEDTFSLDPRTARHVHSHLMYFGNVTPALFALIA